MRVDMGLSEKAERPAEVRDSLSELGKGTMWQYPVLDKALEVGTRSVIGAPEKSHPRD